MQLDLYSREMRTLCPHSQHSLRKPSAVNCYQTYQKMALNYYGHSVMKFNNSVVMIISLLFLNSSIGDNDYHLTS